MSNLIIIIGLSADVNLKI